MVAIASMVALPILPLRAPLPQITIHTFLSTSHSLHPLRSTRRLGPSPPSSDWRRKGCVLVACLPSSQPSASPRSGTSPDPTRLYVSGLSFRTTQESLRNAFQNFGQLVEFNLVMDRVANRPRGFAFLRYSTEEGAKRAIEGMHGKFLDGRVIFVEVAKPRSEVRPVPKPRPRQY